MFNQEYAVLLVDDDPDVLTVSKMALRKLNVFGLRPRIFTANSKASAIELLNGELATQLKGRSVCAVALIDVVMETDHAGLELCEHIRKEMDNPLTTLYVRTGQPGVAPERSVIDRLDINGYIAKTEVTEDKLYTLIKSGVRQYSFTGLNQSLVDATNFMIPYATSGGALADAFTNLVMLFQQNPEGKVHDTLDIRVCVLDRERMLAGRWSESPRDAVAARAAVLQSPAEVLNEAGDTCSVRGNDWLITIQPTGEREALSLLMRGLVPPPRFYLGPWHGFASALAALWKRAE